MSLIYECINDKLFIRVHLGSKKPYFTLEGEEFLINSKNSKLVMVNEEARSLLFIKYLKFFGKNMEGFSLIQDIYVI